VKVPISAETAANNDTSEEADENDVFPDVDRGCNDRLRSTNDHHERGTTHAFFTVRGQLGVLRAQ
jgi:hypothetical protein